MLSVLLCGRWHVLSDICALYVASSEFINCFINPAVHEGRKWLLSYKIGKKVDAVPGLCLWLSKLINCTITPVKIASGCYLPKLEKKSLQSLDVSDTD